MSDVLYLAVAFALKVSAAVLFMVLVGVVHRKVKTA